jgi:hypothetical protein
MVEVCFVLALQAGAWKADSTFLLSTFPGLKCEQRILLPSKDPGDNFRSLTEYEDRGHDDGIPSVLLQPG